MFWGGSHGYTVTLTLCRDDIEGGVVDAVMSGPFIKAILQCCKP